MGSLDEETVKKVIRQVEFYFSDSNLPRDKFLKQTIDDSEDGLVSLALICSFSRMRNHLSLGDVKADEVPEDTVKAVAETLSSSSFLKVSEDGKKIGRTTELLKPEEVIEQIDGRTIAASPLEYDVKLEDVESFFGQFAKVNSVRLPRHVADKKLFSGTALIEFSSEEDADKLLKQSMTYAGVELELKPKKDFDAERAKQAEVEASRPQRGSDRKNNSNAEDLRNNSNAEANYNYPKGLIVAFTLKSLSAGGSAALIGGHELATNNVDIDTPKTDGELDSSKSVTEEAECKVSGDIKDDGESPGESIVEEEGDEKPTLESEGKETGDGEKSIDKTSQKDDSNSTGKEKSTAAVYKDNKDVVLREDLKSVFQKFGTVKFVDFKIGAESGYIRFEEPEAAQKARAAAVLTEEGGLVVKNYIATLDPVSGEAEKEYWNLLIGNQERRKSGNWGRGGKNHRGGRHFKGNKHSRSRGNDHGNRPNKFQKVGAA